MTSSVPQVWSSNDDWSGITNIAERRRRQSRLGQRNYRKRKLLQRFQALAAAAETTESNATENLNAQYQLSAAFTEGTNISSNQPTPHKSFYERTVKQVIRLGDTEQDVILICNDQAAEFVQRFFPDYNLQRHQLSDLATVVHLNVLNAMYRNGLAVGVSWFDMANDDGISPFNQYGPTDPTTSAKDSLPPSLLPTETQKRVVHHPWIDLIPFHEMRDCIINALDRELLDEEELCLTLSGHPEYMDGELTSFVVWGLPWDSKSWELSMGILRKWGWLLQNCHQVVETTNYWRERRGERKIIYKSGGYIEEYEL
ncbi:hypothetical protein TWF694_003715 [Orbilia ellipsospora]|uniref:BZIP domain-containing protein n=1 Tax=Orbilia ellipsospora TaxID=2528407 RepID=A0AAV9X068_9PEZI